MANLLGEPFEEFVSRQINARQTIYGKKLNRTPYEISYLNSTNGWVKLASGVKIFENRLDLLKKNNNKMASDASTGKQLAMDNVLFNGLTSYDNNGNPTNYTGVGKGGKVAYGLDGTDFGYSPMPGITSVNIKDLNRGSIKKATIDIKVFNRNQLEIIDCLYMRLGYTVLLEWGHNQYWDDLEKTVVNQPPSLIDTHFFNDKYDKSDYTKFIPEIKKHRERTRGNYDAMFATISNFSWTFESDGSYNCKIELISLGDIIESLGISISTNGTKEEERLRQANLASATFVKKQVTKAQFYDTLYPGLKESVDNLFKFSFEKLKTINEIEIRKAQMSYLTYKGSDGNSIKLTGWTAPTINPLITDEALIESFNQRDNNIRKIFGTGGLYANEVMVTYYIGKVNKYFNDLRKNKEYAIIEISGPDQKVSIEKKKIDKITDKYVYTHKNPETNTPVEVTDTATGGYTIDWLGGTIYLDGMAGPSTIVDRDPDETLISRKPMGFSNFARSTATGVIRNQLVENTSQNYVYTRLQKNILIAILGHDINYGDFENYIYEAFVKSNLAGGPKDPQFKDENKEEEELDENPNEGEVQIEEFKKRMQERSLRGNFFKYVYDIKNLFTPKSIISKKEKETKSWYQTKNYDQVSFPTLEDIQNGIFCDWGDQSIKIVGYRLNPYKDKELAERWNKEVGWPIYKQGTTNKDFYFAYDKNGKILNMTEKNSDGSGKAEGGTDFFKLNLSPIDKSYYMSFEMLLGFLRDKNISTIDSEAKPPMIDIQLSNQYYLCYAIDNQVSVDPRKVIIANNNFTTSTNTGDKKLFQGLRNFIKRSGNNTYGRLPFVYLNCSRIEELLTKLADKRGEVKIYDFLEKICEDINQSLGGVNNLEVTVNEDNSITIIDQTSIPGIKELFPEKFPQDQAILEVFGYNGNQSNFVTNVGLQTKISKEYATMITIGATSKGSIPGTEATAFSKWNIGIEDRFKNNLTPPDSSDATSNSTSSIDQLREENKTVISNYKSNNKLEYQCLGFTSDDFADAKGNTYLNFNDEFIKNNQKITQEYFKYAQADVTLSEDPEDKGVTESSIGFIPFNLSVDMVGLSGLKIYNRLKVNTSFLPSNYDETLDFIITGVNHKISDNKWTTSLTTLATSKSVMAK